MKLIIVALFVIVFFSNTTRSFGEALPSWIIEKTDKGKKEQPSKINSFRYDNSVYFILEPPIGTVDYYYELFDNNGNYICAPAGGFSGHGDLRCPDWVGQKNTFKDMSTVWRDKRFD